MQKLTPRQVVEALDKYIIGQADAKRSVAIALRNRVRRLHLEAEMQAEVKPKNILMIGPTGVGKTEIARRLANIAQAPFIKVEATKYTEVGYVGRDVESMVRDLVENAIQIVKKASYAEVHDEAYEHAVKRLVKAMRPGIIKEVKESLSQDEQWMNLLNMMNPSKTKEAKEEVTPEISRSRKELEEQIHQGLLDDQEVTIELKEKKLQMTSLNPAMEQMMNLQDSLSALQPEKRIERTLTVKEALSLLTEEEAEKLVNQEDIHQKALKVAQEKGIIFIDEMDKIASAGQQNGQVSREGVQRDILPIVEGSEIQTKYGIISTDHILFIGSGAFHLAKPSDLIPELQGRFPIRVNLKDLTEEDFIRILVEPENAIVKQYQALLQVDGVEVTFTEEAIQAMAHFAVELNVSTDNIGARRLHTIIETVLDDLLFEATGMEMGHVEITEQYVKNKLEPIVTDRDLSQYIL